MIWGRGSRYVYERHSLTAAPVFRVMAMSRLSLSEARSIVKGMVYLFGCILGIVGLTSVYRFRLPGLFVVGLNLIPLTVLGVLGELSLTGLLTRAIVGWWFPQNLNVAQEIRNIPWLKAMLESPRSLVPIAVVSSAALEELFFRGVVLSILTKELGVGPYIGIASVGVLFSCQQIIQLRNGYQAAIIGSSCIAISFIGGILVLLTGSVIPAAISHASFVVFYVRGIEN
jgi:membrane protease YdiL (CAAX protease family)